MIFFPNCKVNIGLDVLRRRTDGFHDIETLMLPITGLCDILEIVPAGISGAEFSQSGIAVNCLPQENFCIKAYELMLARHRIDGIRMHLHKIIPFGAGLGGGSADAAFVIKGLAKVFSLGLGDKTMEDLAAETGSDTAFFIRNIPQMAAGRGEILTPCPVDLSGKSIVIVKPDIHISTAEAYAGITPVVPQVPLAERLAADISTWRETVTNAFEDVVFPRHPVLAGIKEQLYRNGAVYASMSGSGSAVYGIFEGIQVDLCGQFGDMFVYMQELG